MHATHDWASDSESDHESGGPYDNHVAAPAAGDPHAPLHQDTTSSAWWSGHINLLQPSPVPSWRRLRVGEALVYVSDEGYVRRYGDAHASTGCILPGTPYRVVPIAVQTSEATGAEYMEQYLVHDLVWRAFHGEPPEGWEVRHNHVETYALGYAPYSNALACLQIYPATVQLRPNISI